MASRRHEVRLIAWIRWGRWYARTPGIAVIV